MTTCRLLALFATALLAASNAVGQTYNTMVNNGASSNRVDMIFIGDGYRASEIETTYVNHIQGTLNHFFGTALGSPLGRYDQFFNVHRVNVISNQSGADRPPEGFFVDTALDASYWWGGTALSTRSVVKSSSTTFIRKSTLWTTGSITHQP